jgi:hypothetical protein
MLAVIGSKRLDITDGSFAPVAGFISELSMAYNIWHANRRE